MDEELLHFFAQVFFILGFRENTSQVMEKFIQQTYTYALYLSQKDMTTEKRALLHKILQVEQSIQHLEELVTTHVVKEKQASSLILGTQYAFFDVLKIRGVPLSEGEKEQINAILPQDILHMYGTQMPQERDYL